MNPVKALMVSTASDYKYSSFGEYKRGRLGILHENAIKNYKERFGSWEAYLEYHHITNEIIFLGMSEEVYAQKREQAINLLWKMRDQEGLEEAIQIIEEPMLREKYMEQIRSKLKISKKETCRLYADIKEKYII